MKNLLALLACLLVVSIAFAEPLTHKKLETAMSYYGIPVERDGQFMFVSTTEGLASVYVASQLSTGYLEQGEKKAFWKMEPVEGGVKMTITINVAGKEYTKEIFIKSNNAGSVTVQAVSEDRYDWMCLLQCAGGAAFKCIACLTNWVCWATCAGAGVVQCVMGCF